MGTEDDYYNNLFNIATEPDAPRPSASKPRTVAPSYEPGDELVRDYSTGEMVTKAQMRQRDLIRGVQGQQFVSRGVYGVSPQMKAATDEEGPFGYMGNMSPYFRPDSPATSAEETDKSALDYAMQGAKFGTRATFNMLAPGSIDSMERIGSTAARLYEHPEVQQFANVVTAAGSGLLAQAAIRNPSEYVAFSKQPAIKILKEELPSKEELLRQQALSRGETPPPPDAPTHAPSFEVNPKSAVPKVAEEPRRITPSEHMDLQDGFVSSAPEGYKQRAYRADTSVTDFRSGLGMGPDSFKYGYTPMAGENVEYPGYWAHGRKRNVDGSFDITGDGTPSVDRAAQPWHGKEAMGSRYRVNKYAAEYMPAEHPRHLSMRDRHQIPAYGKIAEPSVIPHDSKVDLQESIPAKGRLTSDITIPETAEVPKKFRRLPGTVLREPFAELSPALKGVDFFAPHVPEPVIPEFREGYGTDAKEFMPDWLKDRTDIVGRTGIEGHYTQFAEAPAAERRYMRYDLRPTSIAQKILSQSFSQVPGTGLTPNPQEPLAADYQVANKPTVLKGDPRVVGGLYPDPPQGSPVRSDFDVRAPTTRIEDVPQKLREAGVGADMSTRGLAKGFGQGLAAEVAVPLAWEATDVPASYVREQAEALDAGAGRYAPDMTGVAPESRASLNAEALRLLNYGLPEGYFGSDRHKREEDLSRRIGQPLTEEVKIARQMFKLAAESLPEGSVVRGATPSLSQMFGDEASGLGQQTLAGLVAGLL